MGRYENRIAWLDYARAFAIFCVIVVHSTESIYPINAATLAMLPYLSGLTVISLFTLGRLGVPIFLFLSGYLMLDKEYDDRGIKKFFYNNFFPMLITTEFWILIYGLFNMWYTSSPFNVKGVLKDLLFFRLTDMSHMWYMPVILGLYLWLPLIARGVRASSTRYLKALTVFAFIILFCLPEINGTLYIVGMESLNSYIDLSWSGGIYGLMIILGYFVKKGEFDFVPTPILVFIGIVSYSLTVYKQFFLNVRGVDCAVWYNSLSLVMCALVVLILWGRLNPKRNKCIEQISILSFGIYLIHNMILKVMLRYLPFDSSIMKIGILMTLTFFITYGVAYVMSRFKMSRYLLLVKK